MTEREIKKILKSNGWEITEGKKHSLATNPNVKGVKIPIGTAKAILKQSGIK